MTRLLVASPHRYPDLARLWYRSASSRLLPALREAGLDVRVHIFRDAHGQDFDPRHFPGAVLESPRPQARDFMEFYDAALGQECELLFLMDADLFVLDGEWVASFLERFREPRVAAVSLLRRSQEPGVFALLCRASHYRRLPPPVFTADYVGIETWPRSLNRQPGDRAAHELRALGREIVYVPAQEALERLADFHGTTVIRAAREVFGEALGREGFERLVTQRRYMAMGAYDNFLLGQLYEAVFDQPFAAGPDGQRLMASLTHQELQRALSRIDDPLRQSALEEYFARSDAALSRLARHFGVVPTFASPVPAEWRQADSTGG